MPKSKFQYRRLQIWEIEEVKQLPLTNGEETIKRIQFIENFEPFDLAEVFASQQKLSYSHQLLMVQENLTVVSNLLSLIFKDSVSYTSCKILFDLCSLLYYSVIYESNSPYVRIFLSLFPIDKILCQVKNRAKNCRRRHE